jgi:hypothetical protein
MRASEGDAKELIAMEENEKDNPQKAVMSAPKCSCSFSGTRYCQICPDNPDKRALKITSVRSSEFTSDVVVDGVRYHVQTEDHGPKKSFIRTNVYKDGAVISSKKIVYSVPPDDDGLKNQLHELMKQQHLTAINVLKSEKRKGGKNPSAYLNEVRSLLEENKQRDALKILGNALTEHPFNPFLLSYNGSLEATVNRNYERGVDICKDAIEILKADVPLGHEVFYPAFYLNLGRACLAAGLKEDAMEAFMKGLSSDPEDVALLREVRRLGVRRNPAIPFLKRSNPMNRYIGMLLR